MNVGEFHGNQYQVVSANLPIPKISQAEAAEMLLDTERAKGLLKVGPQLHDVTTDTPTLAELGPELQGITPPPTLAELGLFLPVREIFP